MKYTISEKPRHERLNPYSTVGSVAFCHINGTDQLGPRGKGGG